MSAIMETHETSVISLTQKDQLENPASIIEGKTITIMEVIPESPNPSNAESDESTIAAEEEQKDHSGSERSSSEEEEKESRDQIVRRSLSVSSLQRSNDRLEKTLKDSKVREERLRAHLNKLNMTTYRTERRLKEAVDGKENLENEVRALSTLNGRLAEELHKNHITLATLESEKKELEAKIEELQFERFKLNRKNNVSEQEEEIDPILQSINANEDEKVNEVKETNEAEQNTDAAKVEENLKSALNKADAVSAACVQQNSAIEIIRQAYTDTKKQLELAQFKLTLAKSAEAEQRAQVQILKNREGLLQKEIRDLRDSNETLEIELRHSQDDLERTKNTLDLVATELELSRAQSSALKQQQEEAEKRTEDATQKLKFLGSKLLVAADENSKLQEKLAQSETALKEAHANLETAEESIFDLKAQVQLLQSDSDEKEVVEGDELVSEARSSTTDSMLNSKHTKQDSGDSGISMADSIESTATAINIYEVAKAEKIELRKSKTEILETTEKPKAPESPKPAPSDTTTESEQPSILTVKKDEKQQFFTTVAVLPEPTAVPLEKPRPASAQATSQTSAPSPVPRPVSQMAESTPSRRIINFSRRRSLGNSSQATNLKNKPAAPLPDFEAPRPAPIPIARPVSALALNKPLPTSVPVPIIRSGSMNVSSPTQLSANASLNYPRRRWSLRSFERKRSASLSASSVGSVNSLRLSTTPTLRDMKPSKMVERRRGLESIVEVSSPVSPIPPPPPAEEEKKNISIRSSNVERSASTKETATKNRNSFVMKPSQRPKSSITTLSGSIGKSKVRQVPSVDLGRPSLKSSSSMTDVRGSRAMIRESYVYNPGQSLRRVKSEFDRLSDSFEDETGARRKPERLTFLEFIARETATFDNSVDVTTSGVQIARVPASNSSEDSDSMRRKDSDSSSKKSIQTDKASSRSEKKQQQINQKKEAINQDKTKKGGGWMSMIFSRVRGTKA